jgi:hypothetical protein
MTFEEYLVSKKIDQKTFKQAELKLYESWKVEFETMHPNSFTAQKLYLINPIRRKYILKEEAVKFPVAAAVAEKEEVQHSVEKTDEQSVVQQSSLEEKPQSTEVKPASSPAKPARPVFKPKPKMN